MITAVVENSAREGRVSMDPETLEIMNELRDYMFENVYLRADAEQQKDWAVKVIQDLTDWFIHHPDEVPDSYKVDEADDLTRAIDYVSGMTDRFALATHDTLFRPTLF